MVPPLPVFVNPVTTALLLTVCTPAAGNRTLLLINVTLPVVVFRLILVNVLLLMFCESVAAEFEIYVLALAEVAP